LKATRKSNEFYHDFFKKNAHVSNWKEMRRRQTLSLIARIFHPAYFDNARFERSDHAPDAPLAELIRGECAKGPTYLLGPQRILCSALGKGKNEANQNTRILSCDDARSPMHP
jgi:hypothetical protein